MGENSKKTLFLGTIPHHFATKMGVNPHLQKIEQVFEKLRKIPVFAQNRQDVHE